jgi:two-component system, NarL family, response regulator NreC
MIERFQPKLALLDLKIEGMNGIEVAKQLKRGVNSTSIIVFSVIGNEQYVADAFNAGVKGYVLKESPTEELIYAIREVAAGRRYLCYPLQEQQHVQQTADGYSPNLFNKLTAREREILRFSGQGSTSSEIAEQLKISPRTVESHRANIMRKLGISNATGLCRYAIHQEMVNRKPETAPELRPQATRRENEYEQIL